MSDAIASIVSLSGVRVLDLTNVLAGPYCGYCLSYLGAEVVKVETPESGDLARRLGASPEAAKRRMGLSFVAVNGGKKSLSIDLKSPRGRDVFLKLAGTADVLIEGFRPGVMKRLGLGYSDLAEICPHLVYCSISGFGQDGPWAGRPAYDQIIQGLSGLMSITGDLQSSPLRVGFPVSDTIAGLTAAVAILGALVEQRRTGIGKQVDVSLLESTVSAMGWVVANFLNGSVDPRPMGNDNFTASPSGTFRTGDGLVNISANEQRQYEALCYAIGRPDLITDLRFVDRRARIENRSELTVQIEAELLAYGARHWETVFNEAGVPAGRVLTVGQCLASEQILARDFIGELPDGSVAERQGFATRPGFRFVGEKWKPGAPPELGAHGHLLLSELGYGASEIAGLCSEGAVWFDRSDVGD